MKPNFTILDENTSLSESQRKKNNPNNSKISRWTVEQNVLYVRFLKRNLQKIIKATTKSQKKYFKFQKMSIFIESKTPNQCRSHHQKMHAKFLSIQGIIEELFPKSEECAQSNKKNRMRKLSSASIEEQEMSKVEETQKQSKYENSQKESYQFQSLISDDELFKVLFDIKHQNMEGIEGPIII